MIHALLAVRAHTRPPARRSVRVGLWFVPRHATPTGLGSRRATVARVVRADVAPAVSTGRSRRGGARAGLVGATEGPRVAVEVGRVVPLARRLLAPRAAAVHDGVALVPTLPVVRFAGLPVQVRSVTAVRPLPHLTARRRAHVSAFLDEADPARRAAAGCARQLVFFRAANDRNFGIYT